MRLKLINEMRYTWCQYGLSTFASIALCIHLRLCSKKLRSLVQYGVGGLLQYPSAVFDQWSEIRSFVRYPSAHPAAYACMLSG